MDDRPLSDQQTHVSPRQSSSDPSLNGRGFDVFLSYASGDRASIERIAEWLREHHITPWWDRWSLTPGGSWQEEIVEGLRASGACAVLVGPAGLGDWAREELAVAQDLAAKDRTFRLFMVLLPGAPELSDPGLAFLRTRTWVDLRSGIVDRSGLQDLVSAITGTPRAREAPVATPEICPYRGLEAFEEEHAEFFFGRDRDLAMVLEKLKAGRFLAVLGPSGSGKSSLLRAGLVSALRRGALPGSQGWTIQVVTPGSRPLTTLAAKLTRLFPDRPMQQTLAQLRVDQQSLDLAVSVGLDGSPVGDRVLLVVDQFEELFTLCQDEAEREAFLANLLYAAAIPGGRVMTVVGMRADFYHRCAPYADLRALVADRQFLVGPLGVEGLRQAIEEPARRVGLELEAGLTETIINDLGDRPGTLPLLEHVLLELWRRRQGLMLTLAAYVASNGVEGALAQRANKIYTNLTLPQQDIARRVLLRLVQPGEGSEDTRRRAAMDELVTRPEELGDVEAVLTALADDRLLTAGRDEISGGRVIELTHEALIRGWPEFRTWIAEDREALRAQRHLTEAATEWDRGGRRDDDVYSGARLLYWKQRGLDEVTELERTFLTASRARQTREQAASRRRVRLAVGGVVAALAAVAVVAVIGFQRVAEQRDVAVTERDTANSRELAARAVDMLESDPGKGLGLALQAFEIEPTREAENALSRAMATPGARVTVLAHAPVATSAAFSPDGKSIVSTGDDGRVRLWGVDSQSLLLEGHTGQVQGAAFSPDGKHIASSGDDGTIRVWEASSGSSTKVLEGHVGDVYRVTFSPDGKHIVSAGDDGTVRVWDWAGRGETAALREHTEAVYSAAFSPDGGRIVTASDDGTVRVWDWAERGETAVLREHAEAVYSAAFSPDGGRIVSGGADGLLLWNWADGGDAIFLEKNLGAVHGVDFSPDGTRVAAVGDDGDVRLWDSAGGGEPTVLQGHGGRIHTVAFNSDGKWLVTAGNDGTVRVWDWAAGHHSKELAGHVGYVRAAAFSPDGKQLASGSDDATVRVWNRADGRELAVLREHAGRIESIAFSPDGKRVASASDDGTVRVWEWGSGDASKELRGHDGEVESVGFSPDGRRLVSGGEDGTVRVWDSFGEGEPIELEGEDGIASVAFSPDGKRVLVAGTLGAVTLWDWDARRVSMRIEGTGAWLWSAAFSPDGTRVAGAGQDGIVRVWDVSAGSSARQVMTLEGHEGYVYSVAFSPDGKVMVSGGVDGLRVWDWTAGRERGRYSGYIDAAALTGDAEVVTAELDRLRVWRCIACLPIERVVELARSPLWQ